jgi:hypothetical protein
VLALANPGATLAALITFGLPDRGVDAVVNASATVWKTNSAPIHVASSRIVPSRLKIRAPAMRMIAPS